MNQIAYTTALPHLGQFLIQIWPWIAPNTQLVLASATNGDLPCIIIGNDVAAPIAHSTCLVISTENPTHAHATWVAAPLNSASLAQHIKLWLSSLADAPLSFVDGTVFNPRTRQFGPHTLTEKEVATLQFLRNQPNSTATRAMLQQHVWGYALDADTHTVETHIYRLRQKIEPNPTEPRYIVTNDDGYCLTAKS